MNAVLKYPGAKWSLADWINSRFPSHHSYLEPFFGSGAILSGRKGGPRKGGHGWDTERAQALYNEGWTDKEIAKVVGVVPSTLCSWRSRQGLPPNLRPSKETKASPPAAPEKPIPGEKAGPVELSVELNGCAFALRAPDLETAARVHACAGKLLADMRDSFAEKKGEAR